MKNPTVMQQIVRPDISEDSLFGFVLRSSDTLTLIVPDYQFCPDGCIVLRNSDIKSCKATKYTRYWTHIMESEGLIPDTRIAEQIDLSSWADLLADLKREDEFVMVEDEIDILFLIGRIRRVNKKSVVIDYFDGTGKWREPRRIAYDRVTSVTFGSRYIRMQRKYIENV